ncbi:alcohol dehydrogenase catalytic domain-containing protein [Luteitalea sp.]|uniref:alcohol dehydrogenase catalytic domain-containing protein n=1 Tax=Luteitalea sp. TaxID=2004800 RepID=UPI0025B908A7|nr:alcohol dehydrogenase catalytic domain-containing protein [Luteitalea sp.]
MSTQHSPETSVIIRAFNEERWLPEVLTALERQVYRDFEVLLVDSGSVDRTRDIATARGARIVRLRPEDFTFGHSLNVGIRGARGRFMAIVSAHAIPADEHWLEKLIAPLRDDAVAMVYGGQRGHAISKFAECRDFERLFPDVAHEVEPDKPFANNANSAVTKALWEQHAFDEGLPGLEDIEWAKYWTKQGRKVVYEPAACVIHVHTETWSQVRRRYHREGMAARWVGIRILRHIPSEIWREVSWGLHDLWLAARAGRLLALTESILRFRYEKLRGTVSGIVDSRGIANPARRAEMFFQTGFPAVVVHGPHRAKLEERAVPSLKPGEVLVRVSHVGICGTDLEILEGTLGYYRSGMANYPIVPGHESSGTIVAAGPRVTEFSENDRVVVECIQGCGECPACARDEAIRCRERREVGVVGQDGAYAAYLVARARHVHRVPEGISLAQAALTEPLAVVIKGLRRLGATGATSSGRRCAVVGAGPIGQLAARVLRLWGHAVTAIDQDRRRLSLLNGIAETSESLVGIDSYDWIVEATGDQRVLTELLERSATGATLLLLGLPYSAQVFSFESIVSFDRTVVGSVGSSGADFEQALATLPLIDTAPFLQASFPLAQFEQAWQEFRSRAALKVMLKADDLAT